MFKKRKLTKELEDYLLANQQTIYRLAYSYVKNPEDALDITQEAVFKAIAGVDSLKNPQGMKTWVYRIVSNTALDFLRKQKRLVIMDDENLVFHLEESKVNWDEGKDLDLALAMEKLPPRERGRIVLRYFEDL
ncbi:MAG: sigma-70 family RNA polymerase sigma factor, partial [Desulfitobacterium sp.]|nr:sigma-70 family RNA polymerase sigma factor [Desulfitobacterium sp.]